MDVKIAIIEIMIIVIYVLLKIFKNDCLGTLLPGPLIGE